MAKLDFPNSPTLNQEWTDPNGGKWVCIDNTAGAPIWDNEGIAPVAFHIDGGLSNSNYSINQTIDGGSSA